MIRWFYAMALVMCTFTLVAADTQADPGRYEQELTGPGWKLWLDHGAVWVDDDVYLPPVNVSSPPVNPPTCGWDRLDEMCDKVVDVPGTVEEHFWGDIGGAIPDTGGDYVGVSWWSTTFTLDPDLMDKRIVLDFTQVNLRAEVFVNRQLVGYDVVGNTPFTVDASDAVVFGAENRLDIRITDPVGNFSWNDNILMRWGTNLVPAVHGFGGITGPITLRATDTVHIDDIYVQNKPDPKKADVFVTVGNSSGAEMKGKMTLTVHHWRNTADVVWQKTVNVTVPAGGSEVTFNVNAPKAKLWELAGYQKLKEADLYMADVRFAASDGAIEDTAGQRFGFRFFTVGEKNGDKRFYLNGERVFIIAAMTRGFWPKNGIFATPEMAEREMNLMVEMGYNMMLLHRAIGQPPVMEYADRMGLFTYEEPGGYRLMPNREDDIDSPDEQAFEWRREKLRRMVIRDRSLPSMIIYNLKNEATKDPDEDDFANMRMMAELDPSRIITYNSDRNRGIDYNLRIDPDPYKANMIPYDDTIHLGGWWDHHHWFAFPGYVDSNYNNPRYYLRGVADAPREPVPADSLNRLDESEIIFWGEEGAFGTMVNLERIRNELLVTGATGFREQEHLDWFNHYSDFLDKSGFRAAYPSVEALTMSMGRNLHYFHGRNLENIRISNIADAININGWGSASTRTDLADMYRNPTADPSILAYYAQPLYVAVKLRDKVLPAGAVPIADLWIVNQSNLKGNCTLSLSFANPDGATIMTRSFEVKVTGGETFGELLVEAVELPAVTMPGHYMLNARLTQNGVEKASGYDDIFTVDYSSGRLPGRIAVLEDDGVVAGFLRDARGVTVRQYTPGMGDVDAIVIGTNDLSGDGTGSVYDDILARAEAGTKVIVLAHADRWGEALNRISQSKPPTYEGGGLIRRGAQGQLFVGYSPYLEGLPQAEGMNWEYQCFYKTPASLNGRIEGIRLHHWGTDLIVALGAQNTREILSSLARIPVGDGELFLSSLFMLPNLQSSAPYTVVAKKLILNLLEK